MKQIYYSTFNDISGNLVRLEIWKESDLEEKELVLSHNTIRINYEGDFLQPLKISGCTIDILTDSILTELYSPDLMGVQLRIYKNDSLFWFGYVTPSIYSQNYNYEFESLSVEGVDSLSVSQNIKYSYINGTSGITSFKDVLLHIFDLIDPSRIIGNVYIQNSLSIEDDKGILERLGVQERNFYDESDEPQTLKEVLEDLGLFLGMTITQYKDSYFLFSATGLAGGIDTFTKIDRSTGEATETTLDIETKNLSDIGISESSGSISLSDVYNKINVIANTNSIQDFIPDAINDESDIINQNADPNKYYETTATVDNEEYTVLNGFFKSNGNYYHSSPSSNGTIINEVTGDNVDSVSYGIFWQKYADYKTSDEPSSLDWKTALTWCSTFNIYPIYNYPSIELRKKPVMYFRGGYFVVNLTYRMATNNRANEIYKTTCWDSNQNKEITETFTNSKYSLGITDTRIPCRLSIGNYYYDGEEWQDYDDFNLKVARGYYSEVATVSGWGERNWYKYKNDYGYWVYCSKATYDFLAFGTIKQTGTFGEDDQKFFIQNENTTDGNYDDAIWCEEQYYWECVLKDKFYLVHINKEGDTVFGEDKRLTNTVSWRLGLANSSDGVAIKLPNKVLTGELDFELYTPNHLGCGPQPTTGGFSVCSAWHISELNLVYTSNDTVKSIFSGEHYDPDILYSNTINESYVNQLEDIKMRVNSYNSKAVSYSYVMDIKKGDFVSNIHNISSGESLKAEEHLINHYVSHYSKPKFIYQNNINNRDISPFTMIHENTLDKDLLVNSLEYDLSNDCMTVQLLEL